MKQYYLAFIILIFQAEFSFGQKEKTYRFFWKADIPVLAGSIAGTAYGWHLRKSNSGLDSTGISKLRPEDLSKFKRNAVHQYDPFSRKIGHAFFSGGLILPVVVFIDPSVRNDFLETGFLYFETMLVAGTIDGLFAGLIKKPKPYVYNPEIPVNEKLKRTNQSSFLGSHPAFAAAGTFFAAKVITDHHPDQKKLKYILYSFAVAASITSAYIRYRSGEHFTEDLAAGVLLGAGLGIGIPEIHKNKHESKLSLLPVLFPERGFALNIRLR